MVSFQCDGCGDTIKKPQLDKHRNRCWSTFSCIDCSTTFHGTDYKSHTSCISEAEKYQGALYKGKKAGGHAGNNANVKNQNQNGRYQPYPTSKPGQQPAQPTEEPSTETSDAAVPAAPAIHPSRSALLNGSNDRPAKPGRSAFPSLHPGANYPPPRPFGRNAGRQHGLNPNKNYATGMNGFSNDAPMRSWGNSPAPSQDGETPDAGGAASGAAVDAVTDAPVVTDGEKKKKKKKKGDKGGTGSRANSNAAKRAAEQASSGEEVKQDAPAADVVKAVAEAPAVVVPATPLATEAQHTRSEGGSKKKRKADVVEETVEATSATASSSKTAKKLRKALHSIASAQATPTSLATLIEKVSEEISKKKKSDGVIDATGITRDIKVKFVEGSDGQEGRWVLEV